MRTKTFKPWRVVAIRNWGGAVRATQRTPRSCDGPRGSLSVRPLGLAGKRALQARLARLCLVSLASIAESPAENNRCVSAPHGDMHRRRRESHRWRGLLRSGRVVGSREDGGSSTAIGLVRLRVQSTNLGGFGHYEWPSVRVRERREGAKGRARRHQDIAFAHRARNDPCDQCVQGRLVFLALAGPAVRLLGDSAPRSPRWPAGSPAQWQRPRMWICVEPRDPPPPPPPQAKPGVALGCG